MTFGAAFIDWVLRITLMRCPAIDAKQPGSVYTAGEADLIYNIYTILQYINRKRGFCVVKTKMETIPKIENNISSKPGVSFFTILTPGCGFLKNLFK